MCRRFTGPEGLVHKSTICKLIVYISNYCKLNVDEPNIHTLVYYYVHPKFTWQYTNVCINYLVHLQQVHNL